MGSNLALVMLLIASMLAISCTANKDWQNGNYTCRGWNHGPYHVNKTKEPRKIIVGGSENWHYGFNYKDWGLKNGPIYVNDTLVFKYDPPNDTTRPHSVYLFSSRRSFMNCDLSQARMIGNTTQGGGDGFEFVLRKSKLPYYFACGEHDGLDCKDGLMKLILFPRTIRSWHY